MRNEPCQLENGSLGSQQVQLSPTLLEKVGVRPVDDLAILKATKVLLVLLPKWSQRNWRQRNDSGCHAALIASWHYHVAITLFKNWHKAHLSGNGLLNRNKAAANFIFSFFRKNHFWIGKELILLSSLTLLLLDSWLSFAQNFWLVEMPW